MPDILIVGKKEPEEVKDPEPVSAPIEEQVVRAAIEQVMGLEDSGDKNRYAHKVDTLIDYVKTQTTDMSPESVKWVIRSLELKLGTPPFSEKRINYISQYAWLLSEKKKLDKDIKNFETA
jgi:hypothetical protein